MGVCLEGGGQSTLPASPPARAAAQVTQEHAAPELWRALHRARARSRAGQACRVSVHPARVLLHMLDLAPLQEVDVVLHAQHQRAHAAVRARLPARRGAAQRVWRAGPLRSCPALSAARCAPVRRPRRAAPWCAVAAAHLFSTTVARLNSRSSGSILPPSSSASPRPGPPLARQPSAGLAGRPHRTAGRPGGNPAGRPPASGETLWQRAHRSELPVLQCKVVCITESRADQAN